MNKDEIKFKKEYLEEKLHLIGDRLNDAYGQPLLEELITRMERTVSHFNEEVDGILDSIKSRTQNQHYKLATMRGDDPIKNALTEDEQRITKTSDADSSSDEKSDKVIEEEPKKSKFSFLKRKKKK